MKQHIVPEKYLRQFTDENGYFYEAYVEEYLKYPERKKKATRKNTGQVCYKIDYYDIHDNIANEVQYNANPRFIETFAFRYERIIDEIFEPFKLRKQVITKDNLIGVIKAYLSIKHRNDYVRENTLTKEFLERSLNSTIETTFGNEPIIQEYLQTVPEQVEKAIHKFVTNYLQNEYRPEIEHKNLIIRSIQPNEQLQEIINILIECDFTVFEAPANEYFFITDNPGCTLKHYKNQLVPFNLHLEGFKHVLIPLNSKQVLCINNNRKPLYQIEPLRRINYLKVDPNSVALINNYLIFVNNQKFFCENQEYLQNFLNKAHFKRATL